MTEATGGRRLYNC